jgi:outer membrane protein assembly factor BamB
MGMVFAGDGIVTGFPGGKLGVLAPGNGALRWKARCRTRRACRRSSA